MLQESLARGPPAGRLWADAGVWAPAAHGRRLPGRGAASTIGEAPEREKQSLLWEAGPEVRGGHGPWRWPVCGEDGDASVAVAVARLQGWAWEG